MTSRGFEYLVFDTRELAERAFVRFVPKLIERYVRGMAEVCVEEIDAELGFWREFLLPRGKRAAVRELLTRLWERGL